MPFGTTVIVVAGFAGAAVLISAMMARPVARRRAYERAVGPLREAVVGLQDIEAPLALTYTELADAAMLLARFFVEDGRVRLINDVGREVGIGALQPAYDRGDMLYAAPDPNAPGDVEAFDRLWRGLLNLRSWMQTTDAEPDSVVDSGADEFRRVLEPLQSVAA